ncbi:MAG: DUF5050 domain-containing protein [Oscillospiraceae bacterium]
MYCPSCGEKTAAADRFCRMCGVDFLAPVSAGPHEKKPLNKKRAAVVIAALALCAGLGAGGLVWEHIHIRHVFAEFKDCIADGDVQKAQERYAVFSDDKMLRNSANAYLADYIDDLTDRVLLDSLTIEEADDLFDALAEEELYSENKIDAAKTRLSGYMETGMTITDLNESFASGAYESVLLYAKRFATDHPYYAQAQALYEQALPLYADQALAESARKADAADYQSALYILDEVINLLPDDARLTAARADYDNKRIVAQSLADFTLLVTHTVNIDEDCAPLTSSSFYQAFAVQDGWLYYTQTDTNENGLFRVKTDGTDKQTLFTSATYINTLTLDGKYVYFINVYQSLMRYDMETAELIAYPADNTFHLTVHGDWIYYLKYDPQTDTSNATLYRIAADGQSAPVPLATDVISDYYIHADVIYYATGDGCLYTCKLDGNNVTALLQNDPTVSDMTIFIGATDDALFYSNNSMVYSIPLHVPYTYAQPINTESGSGGLDALVDNGKIYFSNSDTSSLYSMNPDGSDVKELFTADTYYYGFTFGDGAVYLNGMQGYTRYDLKTGAHKLLVRTVSIDEDAVGDDVNEAQLTTASEKETILQQSEAESE